MRVTVSLADLLPRLNPDLLLEMYRLLCAQARVPKVRDEKVEALIYLIRLQAETVFGVEGFAQLVEPRAGDNP